MRKVIVGLLAGAALLPDPAYAADALKFGPAPAWVHPQVIPPAKTTDAPIQLLLDDDQVRFDHGKIVNYHEGAMRIVNAQGLAAAGNVALVWQPATDTVTVNKLQILRDGKVIDVLAGGQTFTVLRRETNLEAATLDGTLTATIQPEGLQEGDIIDLATTIERSDPVLKGHVEAMFAAWGGVPITAAHATLSWPSDLRLSLRQTPNLPAGKRGVSSGSTLFELSARDIQPLVPPNGAPERFQVGRLAEASDFASWSDLANLFVPLFHDASAVPAAGPLHDEVERIRAVGTDPKVRAAQALALVQDRVRYVALLMGQGSYVPEQAETTWSRRFGDCKAKTALLLGILHSLGIEAEAVLVQSRAGDMVVDRLPMIGLFDHVLARAHIGGKDYWLDGTRTGDRDIDAIDVPDFGWGLPLIEHAQLVRMVPAPLDVPRLEHRVSIDASSGVYAPAAITIEEIYRGDAAVELNTAYSTITTAQRDEQMRDTANGYFDSFAVASSSVQFDKAKRELDITIKGSAKLNWKDGWFNVPTSSIGFDPDYDRTAGPLHDVPIAVVYPVFIKDKATIRLPAGFATRQKLHSPVHETLAGIEYARNETVDGDVLTVDSSERSLTPEVSYKEALAAVPRLRALDRDDVYLNLSNNVRATDADVKALTDTVPASAQAYIDRGLIFLDRRDYDKAIADFDQAMKLDPENNWAIANRAAALVWKKDFAAADRDIAVLEKRNPNHAMLFRVRGLKAEIEGDYESAAEFYFKAVQRDPTDRFSVNHQVADYAASHHEDKAIAAIDAALSSNPSWTELLATRANLLATQGKKDAAATDAEALVKDDPHSIKNLVTAAGVYARIGMKDRARQLLDQSAAIPDQTAVAWASRSQVLNIIGDLEGALKASDEALKLGFAEPGFRLLRINMMMKHGKRDRVPAEIEAMLKESPNSNYAFIVAGKTYAALGKTDSAMKAFDRAIAIKPEAYIYVNREQARPSADIKARLADLDAALKLEPAMPEALTQKARLLTDTGDFKGALAVFEQMKSHSADFSLLAQRAIVLYKVGRVNEGQKLFESLDASAHTAVDLNNLCWLKATTDILLDTALAECRGALKLAPGLGGYEDSLGMVLLKLGRLDEALDAYNAAVAQNVGATSLMGRAIVYARKGDRARADADAAAARKQDAQIDATFAGFGLKP